MSKECSGIKSFLFILKIVVVLTMKKSEIKKQLASAGYKPPQPKPTTAQELKAVPKHLIARRGEYKTP